MSTGILGIGVSALHVATANLRTIQHNIANANTAGYHRQELIQAARAPYFTGGGYIGNGVDQAGVVRLYNAFLDHELRLQQAGLSKSETYAAYASKVDALLGKQGLSDPLDAFFANLNEVANDPNSLVARQQMLASANILAGRMRLLGGQLRDTAVQINGELGAEVARINQLSSQLAQLNTLIGPSANAAGLAPNDLLDQREQLLGELNKSLRVNMVTQSDGSLGVFLDNGQPLVVGSEVYLLQAMPDPADPNYLTLGFSTPGGPVPLSETVLQASGGRVAGLLAFRNEVLKPALNELGLVAVGLAEQFNAIHDNGYGLTDAVQREFFTSASSLLRQPTPIGASANVISAALVNSGQLVASAYELSFDGTNYTLTRLSDGASSTGSLAAVTTIAGVPQGFALTASGTPTAGDRWSINLLADAARQFNVTLSDPAHIAAALGPGLAGDNRNALALIGLHTSKTLLGGTASFQEALRGTLGQVASLAASADSNVKTYGILVDQAQARQQALSGVNLDEEATRLLQFQQAYQAAAKAIQVSTTLMNELLSILR